MLIAAAYAGLHFVGIGCPILFFTGISCPGCGMTRAYFSLLRFDFSAALGSHPLFPLPPILLLLFLFKEEGKLPKRVYDTAVWAFCGLFLAVWALRMIFGDGEIVTFSPENGFFLRVIRAIF